MEVGLDGGPLNVVTQTLGCEDARVLGRRDPSSLALGEVTVVHWPPYCGHRFPVRALAWIAGQVPGRGRVRGSYASMFHSFYPFFSSLKINK